MAVLTPVVRYLIACDDIRVDPANPRRVTLDGLTSLIYSQGTPPFPCVHPELCVYVQLTECRGTGDVRIDIVHADSEQTIFQTRTRSVSFGNDPLDVMAVSFRIRNCSFPEAGLYWIRFWYNGVMLEQQPILARS